LRVLFRRQPNRNERDVLIGIMFCIVYLLTFKEVAGITCGMFLLAFQYTLCGEGLVAHPVGQTENETERTLPP